MDKLAQSQIDELLAMTEELSFEKAVYNQTKTNAIQKLLTMYNDIYLKNYEFFQSKIDMIVIDDILHQIARKKHKLSIYKRQSFNALVKCFDYKFKTNIFQSYDLQKGVTND